MAKTLWLSLLGVAWFAAPPVFAQVSSGAFEKCLLVITQYGSEGQNAKTEKPLKLIKAEEGATLYRAKFRNKILFFAHNQGQPLHPEKLAELDEGVPTDAALLSALFILKDSATQSVVSASSNELLEARDESFFYQSLANQPDVLNTLFMAHDQLKIELNGSSLDAKNRREFIETVVGAELNGDLRNAITTELKCPGPSASTEADLKTN